MVFATSLAAIGIRRFDHQPLPWRITVLTTGLTCAGLVLFVVFDSMPMRMVVFTLGQSMLLALMLRLFAEAEGRPRHCRRAASPQRVRGHHRHLWRARRRHALGPRLFLHQLLGRLCGAGTDLMFLSISLNFGFLLMAMDSEVADLPLQDDLTGVGNRRHPVQRLREECARSQWSGEPFALRVINLDGSKE
jgi:predicted signal transduction protein with EAL and GGDEF domain